MKPYINSVVSIAVGVCIGHMASFRSPSATKLEFSQSFDSNAFKTISLVRYQPPQGRRLDAVVAEGGFDVQVDHWMNEKPFLFDVLQPNEEANLKGLMSSVGSDEDIDWIRFAFNGSNHFLYVSKNNKWMIMFR